MTAPAGARAPWERQKGEPPKAAEAFRIYRDLGPRRSLTKVRETLGVSSTMVERWSRKHRWVSRAEAWDDEQDRIGREATLAEVEAMHKRHANLAVSMLNKVAARLIGDPESPLPVKPLDPNKLNARDLGYLADVAVKLERTARGEIESRVAVETSGQVSLDESSKAMLLATISAMRAKAVPEPPGDDADPDD